MSETSSFRRFGALFAGYRWPLLGFVVSSVLAFVTVAPVPYFVKRVFDDALGDERVGLLVALAAAIIVLQVSSRAFGFLAVRTFVGMSTNVVCELRRSLFDQLYGLSMLSYENASISDLHDRAVHETERIDTMARNGLAPVIPAIIFATGITGVLVVLNWVLLLVAVAFVPFVVVINRLSRSALRRASRRMHGAVEQFSDVTFGALRTMRQTRVLGVEAHARVEQDHVLGEAARAARDHGVMRRAHLDLNQTAVAVWFVVVLVAGGLAVIDGRMTVGDLFSFYAGLALLRQPLDQITGSLPLVVAGQESLDRVFEFLDLDTPRPYRGQRQLAIDGRLTVDRVAFGYDSDAAVLRDACLEVRPGEVVALTGANGSGKTTLSSLVAGFYAPHDGRLTMDGVGYHDLDIRHLRRQLGVLAQDPVMVPGTVRENIVYGRADVSDADLDRAIRLAAAGELIAELELGLETPAYQNGPLMSGGQLQRIALARALLGRPRLLILDEPTNHLDVDGVAGVLDGLRSFDEHPAMILITHEPVVAAMADRVYRLADGAITEVRV